jgi:hypothetical protein
MRFVSLPVRTLTTACSVLLLWLVSVLPASAATNGRYAAAGPVCDPQATTLRKLARQHKSFGGPLKQAHPRYPFGLTDPTARLRRGTHTTFDGDEAAIQNDTPAARIDEDSRPIPSLHPLGLLARTVDGRPNSPAFCPRAPRGPPSAA